MKIPRLADGQALVEKGKVGTSLLTDERSKSHVSIGGLGYWFIAIFF